MVAGQQISLADEPAGSQPEDPRHGHRDHRCRQRRHGPRRALARAGHHVTIARAIPSTPAPSPRPPGRARRLEHRGGRRRATSSSSPSRATADDVAARGRRRARGKVVVDVTQPDPRPDRPGRTTLDRRGAAGADPGRDRRQGVQHGLRLAPGRPDRRRRPPTVSSPATTTRPRRRSSTSSSRSGSARSMRAACRARPLEGMAWLNMALNIATAAPGTGWKPWRAGHVPVAA